MKEKYDLGKEKLMNCYEEFKKDNIEECIILLEELKNNIFEIGSELDPYWLNAAGDLFTGVTFEIFKNNKPEDITFLNIFNLRINGKDLRDNILEYVNALDKDSYSYICLTGIANSAIETFSSVIATYDQRMKLYTVFEAKK